MKEQIIRRPLGNTGEYVTELSLGAMNLRLLDTEEEGISIINKVLDLGINLIDTARAYTMVKADGSIIESEVLVKKALSRYEGLDEAIFIVTKGHGYDIDTFDKDLGISLEKLGIKEKNELRIGENIVKLIYFFHGLTEERWNTMKSSGVLEHAKKLQDEGVFTYLGFSSHNGHEKYIEEAIESGYFEVTELPYNVFAPSMEKLIKLAQDKGMGIINMKCFGGNGMVTKSELFKDYCDISTSKRLQFCLSSPYITTVDVGCRFVEELIEDVDTAMLPKLSKKECSDLIESAKRVGASTENTCRECTHCLEKFECPQKIDFPKILALHTRYKVANEFECDINPIKAQYKLVREEAIKCIACNLCLEWCEYKLNISELMKETDVLLRDYEE